jgi:hypothetical protein
VPAEPAARATPPRRSPTSSAPPVRLHLKPGQKGTKHLLAQYGDRLICVRYRYDAQRKKRLKTVEILVAERDWDPPQPRTAPDHLVELRVAFADVVVRQRVKQAGGVSAATGRSMYQATPNYLPHPRIGPNACIRVRSTSPWTSIHPSS